MVDSTQVVASTAITPDLSIVDGQITTTSNQIAEHFCKRHNLVLRAIRNLECSAEFRLNNFAQSSYMNEQGKEQPAYRLTRDGFTFLAMGFTGKDAAQWKEAYIAAFNKMEQELLARTTRPANHAIDYGRISPAQRQDLKEIVNAIVQAGIQKYGETWARLQAKFRVNKYEELPASRYEEARQYLIAKLPGGYAGVVVEDAMPFDATDAPAMAAARKVALDYFGAYRESVKQGKNTADMADIPQEVLHGLVASAVMSQSVLTWFDPTTGEMRCKLVPADASTISLTKDDYHSIVERIPMARIPEMLEALSQRIGCHLGAFSERLQRDRETFRQTRPGFLQTMES